MPNRSIDHNENCKSVDYHSYLPMFTNEFIHCICKEMDDGTLWLINPNIDKSIQINYCPFCGYKARKQLKRIPNNV